MNKFIFVLSWCSVVLLALATVGELSTCRLYIPARKDYQLLFVLGLLSIATIIALFETFCYVKSKKGKDEQKQ